MWRSFSPCIRGDFKQGMESVSLFKMNTVTENYWLISAAAMVIRWWSILLNPQVYECTLLQACRAKMETDRKIGWLFFVCSENQHCTCAAWSRTMNLMKSQTEGRPHSEARAQRRSLIGSRMCTAHACTRSVHTWIVFQESLFLIGY